MAKLDTPSCDVCGAPSKIGFRDGPAAQKEYCEACFQEQCGMTPDEYCDAGLPDLGAKAPFADKSGELHG